MNVFGNEVYPEYQPAHSFLKDDSLFKIYGYCVNRGPDPSIFLDIKEDLRSHLARELSSFFESSGLEPRSDIKDFTLEDYHLFIEQNDEIHHEFISFTSRYLKDVWCNKPYIKHIVENVSVLFGKKAKVYKNQVQFRVVRPNCGDNNPPHRDHWFPYFKPLVNVYVPLSSSYYDSALPVVPFSHCWSDDDVEASFVYNSGKKTVKENGVSYSVPKVVKSKYPLELHRPDILEGDYMLFSPMCVHGGGSNSSRKTRFSFEIRIELE